MGKLILIIEQIRSLIEMDRNQRNQNMIARLQDKAYQQLQEVPEETLGIIGDRTADIIQTLINERQERLDYIRAELIRMETEGSKYPDTRDVQRRP